MDLYGVDCNKEEYKNYKKLSKEDKQYVAEIISFKDNIITQEKLETLFTFKHMLPEEEIIDVALNELKISKENIDGLLKIRLGNRLQIGKGKDGIWKIFDYESAKYNGIKHKEYYTPEELEKHWNKYTNFVEKENKNIYLKDWLDLV